MDFGPLVVEFLVSQVSTSSAARLFCKLKTCEFYDKRRKQTSTSIVVKMSGGELLAECFPEKLALSQIFTTSMMHLIVLLFGLMNLLVLLSQPSFHCHLAFNSLEPLYLTAENKTILIKKPEASLNGVKLMFSIQIIESIPENLTFHNTTPSLSTFYAWNRLIRSAERELFIAAYKSSLQGKHVLGCHSSLSREGDKIYDTLLYAGTTGGINIKMVENYPPKDKGDNDDGIILQKYALQFIRQMLHTSSALKPQRSAIHRHPLDFGKLFGGGKMHSKFIISDNKHFYLGSANLDWRSLSQKMELGVLVENCECLSEDLRNIFNLYWEHPSELSGKSVGNHAFYNMENPLAIQIEGERSVIYLATSPKKPNNRGCTWDLNAIVSEIDVAEKSLDVHIMDYFPLFIYTATKIHFPIIDDALRRAIIRGVRVRILASALHYPEIGMRFLRSLASLNHINENITIEVRIIKIPSLNTDNIVISRERRTHKKFMVTEKAVIIGKLKTLFSIRITTRNMIYNKIAVLSNSRGKNSTSNWSGDYFMNATTGVAIIIKQSGKKRSLVKQMQVIFERDWTSAYSHRLEDYFSGCVENGSQANFCEEKKTFKPSLICSYRIIIPQITSQK
ncbi:phospholipase D domain protein [Dictyocaulus viviparus]|uniref:Phospholipase D domain protein n=1 Tax=Dictyocaulus viviparus TaxID=29172 RepID=A0A0D8Y1D8_DICVI|nr:phospholipase D domain protein [Dictyocaulus viviparus]